MSRIIDAKGKACPMPVLMAKEAISAGESQFTVLVDNTTAVGNLQRLAANQGFDASVEEKDGNTYGYGFDAALSYGYIMGNTVVAEI